MNKIQRLSVILMMMLMATATWAYTVTFNNTSGITITAKVDGSAITHETNVMAGKTVILTVAENDTKYLTMLNIQSDVPAGGASAPRRSGSIEIQGNVEVRQTGDFTYEFTMPIGNVTITPTFADRIDISSGTYVATITLAESSHVFDWLAHTPVISSVVANSTTLTEGTDYTVSGISAYTNAGTYTITVTGKGKYNGEKTADYTISPRNLAGQTGEGAYPAAMIQLSGTSFVYNNAIRKPTISGVYMNGQTLILDTDYQNVTYSNESSKDKGNYTVTITGKGNFTGNASATYTITQAPISEATFAGTTNFVYSGTVQSPTSFTLTYCGESLTATHYDLSYASGNSTDFSTTCNSTNIGTYKMKITAKDGTNYTGSKEIIYTISSAGPTIFSVGGTEYTGTNIYSTPYTGAEIKPAVIVKDGTTQLTENTHFKVIYSNNKNVGTAKISVVGIGVYNFVAETTFNITPKSVSELTIELSQNSFTYNTSNQKPTVTVKDGETTLTENKDYTLVNAGGLNVGTYKATITGIGNYTGNNDSENYSITKLSYSNSNTTITLGTTSYVYDGTAKTPSVQQVKIDGVVIPSTDYTPEYSNNTASGTATVTIIPKTTAPINLSGSASTTFTITKKPVSDLTITLSTTTFTYNGSEQKPTVTVKDGSTTLTEDTHYTLTWADSNSKAVGSYSVTITGIGNYTGSVSKTYVINYGTSDSDFTVTVFGTYTYNGSAHQPTSNVVVKKGETTLTQGTDYTLSYSNNINAGTATVTATGKGNYQFVQTGTFTILPKEITDGMATLNQASFTYNGALQKPVVTITDGTKTLVEGTDYTLVNNGGTNVASYNATITGIGNYLTGTSGLVKNYSITALSLTSATVTLDPLQSYVYDGTEKRPGVQQVKVGNVVVPTADYAVTYPRDNTSTTDDNDNVNAGTNTAKVYINPLGTNLSDSKTQTFSITKKPLTSEMITLSSTATDWQSNSFVYNGTLRTPTVTVSDIPTGFTSSIIAASDYTITNEGGTTVGVYYVTVAATTAGNYSGTIKVPYSIVSDNSETDVTITLGTMDNLTYTGNPITRTITVTKGTTGLTNNTDYEVIYNNNINVGEATITILGKGNYHFVKYAYFNIAARPMTTANGITIALSANTFEYNGSVQKPNVTVTYTKPGTTTATTLVEGTDYTLSNPGATNVGTGYKAVVSGIGNFTGSMNSPTYAITAKALTDAVITLYPLANPVYDGTAKEPAVQKVTVGGQVYTSGYTVSYSNNMNAGTNATVTVSSDGTSTFSGSASTTFTINPKPLADDMVVLAYTSVAYDGTPKEPGVTVTDAALPATFASKVLTLGTDYTLSYTTDHTTPGDKAASIIGKGNYIGTISKPYTIVGASGVTIDWADAEAVAAYVYDGTAKEPGVTVTKGATTLTLGTDYTVSWTNNTHAGTNTAYVTVTGTGNYDFTQTKTFSIAKKAMTNAMVTLENNTFTYNGAIQKPTVTVSDGTLMTANDYTISNDGNINANAPGGSYTVTVTATSSGNYSGSGSQTYTINPLSISSGEVNLSYISTVFNGSVQKPSVQTVYANGHQLTATTDYTISWPGSDYTNQGAKTVTVTGTGNYKDSKDATYTIEQKEVTSSMITLSGEGFNTVSNSFTYDGASHSPTVTVANGTLAMTLTTDYTLTNPAHTEVGNYVVQIDGTGNYKGTATKQYSIVTAGATAFTVEAIPAQTFTGLALMPEPVVKATVNNVLTTLTKGTHYTVAWANNVNVGTNTASVIVTGLDNYAGTQTVYFTINPKELIADETTLSPTVFSYNGTEQKPTVTVKDGTTTLVKDKDYTLAYPDDIINQGTKTITITGIGNYASQFTKTYAINQLSLSTATITLATLSSYVYDGAAKTPAVQLVKVGELVVPATAYDVAYTGNVNVGTATVTVTAKMGTNFKDGNSTTFNIEQKTVTSDMIYLSSENLEYTGSVQAPTVTVKDGTKLLALTTDYTLSNPGGTAVGTYEATISGQGNYKGSAKKQYSIIAQGATGFTVDEITGTFIYSGSPLTPAVTVKKAGTADVLTLNTDYTVAYTDNTNVGTATVTVTGKGNYSGTRTVNFTIGKKPMTDAMVTLTGAPFTYNGGVQKPAVTVSDGSPSIISASDYTISNDGNINAGNYTVTVTATATGNYSGSGSQSYTINPYTLNATNTSVILDQSTFVYDRTAKKPNVLLVKVGDTMVVPTFTTAYSNNVDASNTATVTVTGSGNFTGAVDKTFVITPKSVTSDMIKFDKENFVYDGTNQKPTVTAKDGENTMTPGTDYTLTNEGGTNVGVYYAYIDGKGNYSGRASKPFYIITQNAAAFVVSDIADTEYDGTAKEPVITVTDNTTAPGTVLVKDENYTVSYLNNKDAGIATVIVTGMGSYAGTVTKNFNITPKPLAAEMISVSPGTFTFNGSLQRPDVTVTDGTIMKANDYTVINSGNVNQGTYYVTVIGQGNYKGTITNVAQTKYTITPLSIAEADVNLYELPSYVYDGTAKNPSVREVLVNNYVVPTTGYDVSYGTNIVAGPASITITGKGNFTGTKTVNFTIAQKEITSDMILLSNTEYIYTGELKKPEVTVKQGETTLTLDTDYTLSNNGGIYVGQYDVTVTGQGNYTGTASQTYNIIAQEAGSFVVTLSTESVVYTGGELKPAVTVKKGDVTLNEGTDYTVMYIDNINVGMATVTVRAKGNYEGTVNKTFFITPKTLTGDMVTLSASSFTYNGVQQRPVVTVSDHDFLTSNDYYITNEGGVNIGSYNVIITGKSNYTGTVTKQFSITPLSLNDANIVLYEMVSNIYDGKPKNPGVREVTVGTLVVPTTGYTTSVSPNINVGTVTVTVTGKDNFTGSAETAFVIMPKPLTSSMMTLTPTVFNYNGTVQKPSVTVKDGKVILTEDTDYTLTNEGGKEAGTYEVTVKGIGNYTDEATQSFIIVSSGANTFVVTLETSEYTFDGTAHKPAVTVTMEERTLSEGTDYTLTYSKNTNAGTALVTVKGVGDYTGEQVKTFTILPKALTDAMVTLDKTSFIYNEKVQKPEVTVADGTIMTAEDYQVTNDGGTEEGTYQVVVTGQNNYKGVVIKAFTITREEIHGDDDPEHPDEKLITYTPTEEGSDEVKVSGFEGTEEQLEHTTSVTIPTTFTSNGKTYTVVGISANAFANVPNLTDVYLPDTEEPLEIAEDAIPASVTVHTTLAQLDDYALMPSLSESFKVGKIMTTVTAKNRYWTFSSGVDVYVPDGVSVYIVRERDNAAVTIVELSDNDLTVGGQRIIKHNNGVLISSEGNDTPYDLVACGRRMSSGSAISTDDFKDYGSMNCLDPVIVPTHYDTGYYFLKNNEFYSIQEESEDVKVPAGKAVLYLRQAASSPSYSPIMQLVNTGEVTNINGKEDTDEGDWYDMSGRKLNGRPTKKGVYIQNNKKIVIR